MILPASLRTALSLTRFQAMVGITAGILSIGATVWGIIAATRAPVTTGEVVTIVLDARTEKPVPNALVELGTPRGAIITTLLAAEGHTRQTVKEGLYRLRVIHPKFGAEVRPVYVLAGHSQEIRVRLTPHPPPVVVEKEKPGALGKAGQAIKKLFQGQ
jgi:hypothetical protein